MRQNAYLAALCGCVHVTLKPDIEKFHMPVKHLNSARDTEIQIRLVNIHVSMSKHASTMKSVGHTNSTSL